MRKVVASSPERTLPRVGRRKQIARKNSKIIAFEALTCNFIGKDIELGEFFKAQRKLGSKETD